LPTLTPDGEYDIRMSEAHDLVSSDLIKELFDEGLVKVRIDQGWAMVAGNLTWPVLIDVNFDEALIEEFFDEIGRNQIMRFAHTNIVFTIRCECRQIPESGQGF
jgi:hypothetical protein